MRGQIADPHLAAKAREGRVEDIRPCISCNQVCIGRRMRDYWASCLVNPSVAREHEWGGDRPGAGSRQPREILVVGGGPAGLEDGPGRRRARPQACAWSSAPASSAGSSSLAAGQPERGEIAILCPGTSASWSSSRSRSSCAAR